MNWLQIIEDIIGVGEEIVPLFIHNPQSQKIEGVVVSNLNGILTGLGKAQTAQAAAKPALKAAS
jgi:hypothetical protein